MRSLLGTSFSSSLSSRSCVPCFPLERSRASRERTSWRAIPALQVSRHVCLELDASLAFAFPFRLQHVRAPRETSLGPYDTHVAHSLPTGKKGGRNPQWEKQSMGGVRPWIRRSPGPNRRGSGVREGGRFPSGWVPVVGGSPGGRLFRFSSLSSIGRDPVPSGSSSFRSPIQRDLESGRRRKRSSPRRPDRQSTTTSTRTCVERDGNQGRIAWMHEGWCASGKGCGKVEGRKEAHDAHRQTCASLCPR